MGADTDRGFQVGLVLPMHQYGPELTTPRWAVIRELAVAPKAPGSASEIADQLGRSTARGSRASRSC